MLIPETQDTAARMLFIPVTFAMESPMGIIMTVAPSPAPIAARMKDSRNSTIGMAQGISLTAYTTFVATASRVPFSTANP